MDQRVTVQEVMDREYVGVSESDTVAESAELMLAEGCETVVVLRGSEPVGVVDERDALAALVADEGSSPVAEAMSEDVPTVAPQTTVGEAADLMSARATQRLVVTEGDRTVGVLSEHDLVAASFGPERADPQMAVAGGTADRDAAGTESAAASSEDVTGGPADRGFEDQSICEACGSFARDLATFNGQLLCSDCRDI